jgi:hypothetical protein
VAYPIGTTNEPGKKTHPLNGKVIAIQVFGKKRLQKFPGLKPVKQEKHGQLAATNLLP